MLIPLSTIFNKKHAKKQTGETKNVRREENGAFFFRCELFFLHRQGRGECDTRVKKKEKDRNQLNAK